jgi:hypothetical protein
MRGRTVYRETGRKETRGGRKEKRGRKKRERRNRLAYPYDFGVRLTIFWAILRPNDCCQFPYDSANLRYFRKVFGSGPSHLASPFSRLTYPFLLKIVSSLKKNSKLRQQIVRLFFWSQNAILSTETTHIVNGT